MSIIKSRKNLQLLSKQNYGSRPLEYDEIDKFLDTLWHDMRFTFSKGYKKYAFDPNKYFKNSTCLLNTPDPVITESFRLTLMENIRNEYPGCTVSYIENLLGLDRIERLIIIDWTD